MAKTPPKASALETLHSFVVESNFFLEILHAVARLPADADPRTTIIAERGGMKSMVVAWFDVLDTAYKANKADEVRVALSDLAGAVPRWADERFIVRQVRNPNGIFLRRFEAKQFAVERALAALATPARKASSKDKDKPPVLNVVGEEKLRLLNNNGSYSAKLDGGAAIPLNETQYAYLDRLVKARGGWYAPDKGSKERPDKIRKSLPASLNRIIKSKGGSGTCLTIY